MALPLTSFNTTMGMFVTGSINSPRIFISTSLMAGCTTLEAVKLLVRSIAQKLLPGPLVYTFSRQRIRPGTGDTDIDIPPQQVFARRIARCLVRSGAKEIQSLIL